MNTKFKKIRILLLGSTFIANIANAAGVVEYNPYGEPTEESALTILETPTLGDDSAYQLSATETEGVFTITKYLKNTETGELTPVLYNVLVNDLSNKYVDFNYTWQIDEDTGSKSLVLDLDYTIYTSSILSSDRVDTTTVTWTPAWEDSLGSYDYSSVNWDNTTIIGDFIDLGNVSYGGAIYNYSPIYSEFFSISEGTTYHYSCNSNNIKLISSNFIGNSATTAGGAIYNSDSSSIEEIRGDFMENYVSSSSTVYGGAIYNEGEIGTITGNFIGNYAYVSRNYTNSYGGAICNAGTISDITGDFIGNYVFLDASSFSSVYGGAIDNTGTIESITGNFIGNYALGAYASYGGAIDNTGEIGIIISNFIGNWSCGGSITAGGAISNYSSYSTLCTIGDVTGDFIGNYVYSSGSSYGGAIYNYVYSSETAIIGEITGDFIGNYALGDYAYGGAIYNNAYRSTSTATIGKIIGDFVSNYVSASTYSSGGAIYNYYGLIDNIAGNFISNWASGYSSTSGGAIYNSGTIGNITGDFTSNYAVASSSLGGAIYNTGITGDIIGDFISNYTSSISSSLGGAIYNSGAIGNIIGDFIENYTYITSSNSSLGGAIYNEGEIGDIAGDFIGNYVCSSTISSNSYLSSSGGAIYNKGEIGDITGDFIGNYASSIYYSSSSSGGAIYNEGSIGDIIGDFIENYATSSGGAIYNSGTIGDITGNFIGNYASSESSSYSRGAIYNSGEIGDITGDFIDNLNASIYNIGVIGNIVGDFINNSGNIIAGSSRRSYCASFYNGGTIGDITGDFIGNYASSESSTSSGGAIYNEGSIGDIIGDFIENYATSSGGAIYNSGTIGDITGNFIGNYASSESSTSSGGAIYNSEEIGDITGDFIGNYASSESSTSSGGAIYNSEEIGDIIGNFIGNYTNSSSYSYGGAIYNSGTIESVEGSFTDNYAVSSNSSRALGGAVYLSGSSASITFSATTTDITHLGNWAGTSADSISASYDSNGGFLYMYGVATANFDVADGLTMTVGDGTVGYDSIASYNSTSIINKIGEGDLTINSSMQYFLGTMNVNEGTLNMKNVFYGSLVVADGATLNTYITDMNVGSTVYSGTITGVDVLDVYFDSSINFDDVLGTTTTIFNSSKNSSLTINLDSGDITGAYVEGNTVVVGNDISIDSETITAIVSKDSDTKETSISIAAGTFEIAEGSTQSFDSISTEEGAYLELSGGTLSTSSDITLASDNSTSGIVATSGVIDSSATVSLSEGTTTISENSSLEIIAKVSVAESTTSSFGGIDSNVILQDTIYLGESSSLELVGNVSGSAGVLGEGKELSYIKYTGTYSVGNSPALVTHSNTTMDLTETTLQMEIFGTNGVAGVDFDKIVFENVDLSFGAVEIILEGIDTWADWSAVDGAIIFSFDLFDFDSDTDINLDEFITSLIYDDSSWYAEVINYEQDGISYIDDTFISTEGDLYISISVLSSSAVPEPSTYAMIIGLLSLGFAYYRRRK